MNKRSALIFSMFVAITLFFTAMGSAQMHDTAAFMKKSVEGTNVNKMQNELKASETSIVDSAGGISDIAETAKTEAVIPKPETPITKAAAPAPQAKDTVVKLKKEAVKVKAPSVKVKAPAAKKKTTGAKPRLVAVSRAKADSNYLIPWFGQAEKILARGDTAKIYDIKTGLSFNIKRTYGYNHADCETLTKADTAIMKKIYGGNWSWARRPVIVIVDGRKIAASMAGMPHAGLDNKPANQTVTGRSEGYGTGANLDTVKGNNMDGHFDIHFLGSRTHGTNSVNAEHQNTVKEAALWAEKNY